jgi:hypothetical protein
MSIIVPLQTNKSLYSRLSDEILLSKLTLTSTWNLNPTSPARQCMLLFVNPLAVSTQETENPLLCSEQTGFVAGKLISYEDTDVV